MKLLTVLVRREFWEHRNAFVRLPVLVSGLVIVLLLLVIVGSEFSNVIIETDDGDMRLADANVVESVITMLAEEPLPLRRNRLQNIFWGFAAPFFVTLWFVVFFYLLDTLYQDRKDRSILFWKSLPVSDWQSVLSKMITGLLCVPGVYLLASVIVHLCIVIVGVIAALANGAPVVDTILLPSLVLAGVWLDMLVMLLFVAVWALPFYSWVLFVSASARSVPFIWLIVVPVVLCSVEVALFKSSYLSQWMGEHSMPLTTFSNAQVPLSAIVGRLFSPDLVLVLVVSIALLFGTVWFRGRADEI
jgi:ABC-2 type transport system permease protein